MNLDSVVQFLWLLGFGQVHLLVARRQRQRASSVHSLFRPKDNTENSLNYLEPMPQALYRTTGMHSNKMEDWHGADCDPKN